MLIPCREFQIKQDLSTLVSSMQRLSLVSPCNYENSFVLQIKIPSKGATTNRNSANWKNGPDSSSMWSNIEGNLRPCHQQSTTVATRLRGSCRVWRGNKERLPTVSRHDYFLTNDRLRGSKTPSARTFYYAAGIVPRIHRVSWLARFPTLLRSREKTVDRS